MSSTTLLTTLNLSLGGLVFLLGFIILRENPGYRLNRVVALMLFFGGLGAVLTALSFLATGPAGLQTVSGGRPDTLQNMSYVWEFFFPTLFLFASTFPEERAFTRRPGLLAGRIWTPGFGTLVFAPHVFHFVVVLMLSMWKPDIEFHPTGLLRYAAPVLGIGAVFVRLFLIVHQALFSLVNLGFGFASVVAPSAAGPPPSVASTSSLVILPPAPEPLTLLRSMPLSAAMRLATGVALASE